MCYYLFTESMKQKMGKYAKRIVEIPTNFSIEPKRESYA